MQYLFMDKYIKERWYLVIKDSWLKFQVVDVSCDKYEYFSGFSIGLQYKSGRTQVISFEYKTSKYKLAS